MITTAACEEVFKQDLIKLIPQMRAFALTLCRDRSEGEDLAQEALLKAWHHRASYTPGTNMKAWVFMIIRNYFYSIKRRSWRQSPLDREVAENTLLAVSDPDSAHELDEVRRAMALLPDEQRESLILVGVAGLPYEEVSMICGCPVGTIKSRVSRARKSLLVLLAQGGSAKDDIRPVEAMATIVAEAERLRYKAA